MRQAKQILAKEMTRQEFLRVMGLGILAVLGVANFMSFFSKAPDKVTSANSSSKDDSHRFGSRKFGV